MHANLNFETRMTTDFTNGLGKIGGWPRKGAKFAKTKMGMTTDYTDSTDGLGKNGGLGSQLRTTVALIWFDQVQDQDQERDNQVLYIGRLLRQRFIHPVLEINPRPALARGATNTGNRPLPIQRFNPRPALTRGATAARSSD